MEKERILRKRISEFLQQQLSKPEVQGLYLDRKQLQETTGIDLEIKQERELLFDLLEEMPEVSGCFYDTDFGGVGIEFVQEQRYGMRL